MKTATASSNKNISSLLKVPNNRDYKKTNISALTKIFNKLILLTGENPKREGLKNTAKRAAKAWLALTRGYNYKPQNIINNALFACPNDEIVIVKDIELFSICEHHLLPFTGKCHVGYIPNGKVIGLSKIARIINLYSKRLQIQEKLSQQIADCCMQFIAPKGAIVLIEATHLCMSMRGVKKYNAVTKTLASTGIFKNNNILKQNFLNLIK